MGGGFARHHKFSAVMGCGDEARMGGAVSSSLCTAPRRIQASSPPSPWLDGAFTKNRRAIVQFLRMAANRGVLMIATQRRQCGAVKPPGVSFLVGGLPIGRYERGARRGQNHAILQDRFHLEVSGPKVMG